MSDARSMISADQYLGGLLMFFWRRVRRHLFLVLLLPLVAMAVGYFTALQVPPVQLAQGHIRLGRIDGAEATSLLSAVSRVNSPSFKQRVVESMSLPGPEGVRSAQLIFGSLTAKPQSQDTIAISVRASTGQQAREAVTITVGLLDQEQRKTWEPMEADIKGQLAASEAAIAGLLEAKDSLAALAKEELKDAPADPASAAFRRVWLSDLLSRNEQRLATARSERHTLAARLGAWKTYPASLVDDAFVSPSFVFASPAILAIFSGAIVFLLVLLGVLLRRSKVVYPD